MFAQIYGIKWKIISGVNPYFDGKDRVAWLHRILRYNGDIDRINRIFQIDFVPPCHTLFVAALQINGRVGWGGYRQI